VLIKENKTGTSTKYQQAIWGLQEVAKRKAKLPKFSSQII